LVGIGFPGKSMAEGEIIGQEVEGGGGNYRAFLLRCWQEDVNEESHWRFTLVQMGEEGGKRGFACLEDLVTYLQLELQETRMHTN
jgi:hypothetical protein